MKLGKRECIPIKPQKKKITRHQATGHLQNVTAVLQWTESYIWSVHLRLNPTSAFWYQNRHLTIYNLENYKLCIYKIEIIINTSQDYCEGQKK